MITLTDQQADEIVLALEKAYRLLEKEGFNEQSTSLIYKGRKLMRELCNVQRVKCDIPSDTKVIRKPV